MKTTTVFAVAAFALAGTACSDPAETETQVEAATAADVQTVSADDTETTGTFNLNLPSATENSNTGGGLNLRLGDNSDSDRLLVGGGGLVDTDFGDAPVVSFDLGEDASAESNATAATDDDIIRIEPK